MLHKFKIGQTVYHPKDRMLSTARGTYTVTGLMLTAVAPAQHLSLAGQSGELGRQ
jgi:hypothetical protein